MSKGAAAIGLLDGGAIVGKYHILRELGRGGMGVVYLAEDTSLARTVALKVLHPSLSLDPAFVERFRTEARCVAGLSHPNIVRVNSLHSENDRLIIDMEYVDGPSLLRFLDGGRQPAGTMAGIMADVLRGLSVCHRLGIVHRDIKPSNILLEPEGRAKLVDFGLATAYAVYVNTTVTSGSGFAFMGTPRYLPPEAWDDASPSPAWDLYATGTVLYEALCGSPPYNAMSPMALVRQMASKEPLPLCEAAPHVSAELAELVHDLICPDQEKRLASAEQALERLQKVPEYAASASADTPTVRNALPRVALKRPSPAKMEPRRIRQALSAAAGLALVCVAVAAWFSMAPSGRGGQRETSVATATQEDAARAGLLTAVQLANFPRNEASRNLRFFHMTVIEETGEQSAQGMLSPAQDGVAVLIAATDRGLWRLSLKQGEGERVEVEGDWAEYRNAAGLAFREGRATGWARWTGQGHALAARLRLVNSRDNASWDVTLYAEETREPTTDTRFILDLEDAALLQPLLYRDLLPRDRSWAHEVEAVFPAVAAARVEVPLIQDEAAWDQDGRLDDALWARRYRSAAGPMGYVAGRPPNRGARLRLCAVPEGLLLGIRLPQPPSGDMLLEMGLLPAFDAPLQDSGRLLVEAGPGQAARARQVVGGEELDWDCDWQFAFDTSKDWQAEVLIPAAGLREDLRPHVGVVWRLNCSLSARNAGGPTRPVVQWGYPETAEAQHGMLLHFETATSAE